MDKKSEWMDEMVEKIAQSELGNGLVKTAQGFAITEAMQLMADMNNIVERAGKVVKQVNDPEIGLDEAFDTFQKAATNLQSKLYIALK